MDDMPTYRELIVQSTRGQYPGERAEEHWRQVYPLAIPNYATMNEIEKSDARQELRDRVRWRP